MRARNGLRGRSEVSEVIGALSQAEGCWTFDARDWMPIVTPYRASPVDNAWTATRAPSRASGFVLGWIAEIATGFLRELSGCSGGAGLAARNLKFCNVATPMPQVARQAQFPGIIVGGWLAVHKRRAFYGRRSNRRKLKDQELS